MNNTVLPSPLLYSNGDHYYVTNFTPRYLIEAHRRSLKWESVTLTKVHSGLYEVTEW